MKIIQRLLILVLLLAFKPLAAQHNPYLDKKKKNLPSAKMAKSDRKHYKQQKRASKKQMRKSKRQIGRSNKRKMRGN